MAASITVTIANPVICPAVSGRILMGENLHEMRLWILIVPE
jgi:hypothetical protein